MPRVSAIVVSLLIGSPLAWAQPNPQWIRVAVVQGDPAVNLQIHGRFTVLTLATHNPLHTGRRLDPVAVRALPEGIALGAQVWPVSGVRIETQSNGTINLNGKRLRGAVDIVRQQDLTLLVVNHVALEDYLRGVLSKEAPDYWPLEALKAIAIIARTYAVHQRFTKEQGAYDVTADVMSQDYGGKTSEKAGTTKAVKATEGWILMYRTQLFPTFYHSTCGGITEHARVMGRYDLEPLRGGVECSFCAASPFFRWQRRLTKADVAWALRKSRFGSIGPVADIQVTRRTATGRAQDIAILGQQRTVTLSGYDFRALFGFDRIRSPFFTVTQAGDLFFLEGRGWGHGVGLCQWGAAELARRGFSAPEILAYYYPGAVLVPMDALDASSLVIVRGDS